ncbi:ABC transporter ATP-binding protein [Sporosarcina sp. JAI121]|uniref:ABC transporter ATP-binding protein n=1 Tax=Sporosarcina sp. JAI121 TaxID=2723064 RepID=UPI0015CBB5F2|nr:ABC transporter ATP-binding protein [Sporosarcina sp. JAI121]NYF25250.1 putative hydroxymethylpyrimidine transport system ATP-binding protein [Sporosarcina sp. JAI121]
MLSFNSVSFTYQSGGNILDNLSFNVRPGEFISIVGVSGSGKSTIFRLVTGLDEPSAGIISLASDQNNQRLGKVGYMPQQDLLLPWRTILENACLPLEIAGMDKREARNQVMPLLHEFGLAGTKDDYPAKLSGGMKQRVAFLRAVLSGNPLLLLDEPFSALDAITKLSMQEWLVTQWERRKSTVLFITHDIEEALFLSDRIFLLQNKPVTSVDVIEIPLGRPRTRSDLHRPEMLLLKEKLMSRLQSEVTV